MRIVRPMLDNDGKWLKKGTEVTEIKRVKQPIGMDELIEVKLPSGSVRYVRGEDVEE